MTPLELLLHALQFLPGLLALAAVALVALTLGAGDPRRADGRRRGAAAHHKAGTP